MVYFSLQAYGLKFNNQFLIVFKEALQARYLLRTVHKIYLLFLKKSAASDLREALESSVTAVGCGQAINLNLDVYNINQNNCR